jgi:hypothetical protein
MSVNENVNFVDKRANLLDDKPAKAVSNEYDGARWAVSLDAASA